MNKNKDKKNGFMSLFASPSLVSVTKALTSSSHTDVSAHD